MNPLSFLTHPSVRIKGTENNYVPIICPDSSCSNKIAHMHCPFCVQTESYQDPVILKAHYRVKHVDKGIEFAGLKVLRCCDHCDIVGVIKGEKRFKGAHWHCYKCRNGFNRRDEAVKHYKTHFRNPQTTFQIQIAQDVHQANTGSQNVTVIDQDIIHPALTQAACLATTDQLLIGNGICKNADGTVQVSIAANETINTADGQTIMIISEEQLEAAQIENSFSTQIISAEDVNYIDHKESLERKYESAEIRCQRLEEEKLQLRTELEQYKQQVVEQVEEIQLYKRREQELMNQLQLSEQVNLQDLMSDLHQQHKELLSAQLTSLRQAFLTRLPHELVTDVLHETTETFEVHLDGIGEELTSVEDEEKLPDTIKVECGDTAVVEACVVMCMEDDDEAKIVSDSINNTHSTLVISNNSHGEVVTLQKGELSAEEFVIEPLKKKFRAT